MIFSHENLRPLPEYPVYPPYHVGEYMEDYFYKRFINETPDITRDFIGISWTTLYCDNKRRYLQSFLNSLPRDGKYFTILQHDDAPQEYLPTDTICFSAGGNVIRHGIVPIPLLCSRIITKSLGYTDRPILASFVGSTTHPIRNRMTQSCLNDKDIVINIKGWTPIVQQDQFVAFVELGNKSIFSLCPRGYGANSFRIYEVMQLGSIPVIITDRPYLPWTDELDWTEFSVLITEDQIPNIPTILRSYSSEKINQMRNKIADVYPKYFTMGGMYDNIIKRIV